LPGLLNVVLTRVCLAVFQVSPNRNGLQKLKVHKTNAEPVPQNGFVAIVVVVIFFVIDTHNLLESQFGIQPNPHTKLSQRFVDEIEQQISPK
jgi:hypothetical protein